MKEISFKNIKVPTPAQNRQSRSKVKAKMKPPVTLFHMGFTSNKHQAPVTPITRVHTVSPDRSSQESANTTTSPPPAKRQRIRVNLNVDMEDVHHSSKLGQLDTLLLEGLKCL